MTRRRITLKGKVYSKVQLEFIKKSYLLQDAVIVGADIVIGVRLIC
jgi:hypothetical protein